MEEKKRGRQLLQFNTRSPRWEDMWLDEESGGPPDREARTATKPESRRCTATKSDGSACPQWAVRESEPALCLAHGGLTYALPVARDEGRCTAQTKLGKRCRLWATHYTRREGRDGPPLCCNHGGLPKREALPPVSRCTATTKSGARCRKQAMRTTCAEEYDGPALCNVHAGETGPPVPPADRRCSATTRQGRHCRAWAMHSGEGGEGPALCAIHAGVAGAPPGNTRHWKHGGHSRRLFPGELQMMAETKRLLEEGQFSLDWELAVTRRLLEELLPGTEPGRPLETMLRSAGQVFRGTRIVGHLLKMIDKLEKEQQEVEKWERWADEALRELAEEEGLSETGEEV